MQISILKKILRIPLEKHLMIPLKKDLSRLIENWQSYSMPTDFENVVSRKTRLKLSLWFSRD